MADGNAGISDVACSVSRVRDGASVLSRVGDAAATVGSVADAVSALSAVVDIASLVGRIRTDGVLWIFSSASGPRDMIAGASIVETSGAGTSFLSMGVGDTERAWGVGAGTCRRLFINRDVAPGVGCSITYTVRRNGADTGIVVTLGAADTSGASTSGTTVVFAEGDTWSLKQVRSGAVAAGEDRWLTEFQLAS